MHTSSGTPKTEAPVVIHPSEFAAFLRGMPLDPTTPDNLIRVFRDVDTTRVMLIIGAAIIAHRDVFPDEFKYLCAGSLLEDADVDLTVDLAVHRIKKVREGLLEDETWACKDPVDTLVMASETFVEAFREEIDAVNAEEEDVTDEECAACGGCKGTEG